MAEVDVLCHDTAMLSLLAFLLALALAPQQAPSATSGTFIGADEVANTLKQSIANNTVDQPIKGLTVNGHRATVAMLHRKTAETSALIHDRVADLPGDRRLWDFGDGRDACRSESERSDA
jgi:hypothetical protein